MKTNSNKVLQKIAFEAFCTGKIEPKAIDAPTKKIKKKERSAAR